MCVCVSVCVYPRVWERATVRTGFNKVVPRQTPFNLSESKPVEGREGREETVGTVVPQQSCHFLSVHVCEYGGLSLRTLCGAQFWWCIHSGRCAARNSERQPGLFSCIVIAGQGVPIGLRGTVSAHSRISTHCVFNTFLTNAPAPVHAPMNKGFRGKRFHV